MTNESRTSPPEEREPFQKFADLAKQLAAMPKKEVKRRESAYQKKKARKKGSS